MNTRSFAAVILAALLLPLACAKPESPAALRAMEPNAASAATIWYCPMHPSYRSDRPGNCPICNMQLVPLREGALSSRTGAVDGRESVVIPAEREQLIGVKTSPVVRSRFTRTIRAAATVEVDERRLSTVSLKFGGWIEELSLNAVGQEVKKGDPILSIWSPELYEAEKSYLIARSMKSDDSSAEIARRKLVLWDMTEAQIAELEKLDDPAKRATILSKVDGIVVRRDATVGGAVEPQKPLFEIADLASVWVTAEVYESEMSLVKAGAEASIEIAARPGEVFRSRVAYVYPTLDTTTRTARVRLDIENRDRKLAPGMYATVSIAVDLGEQLAIDEDAVLDSGTRQLVFVAKGAGLFEPREVAIGHRGDGRAIVERGLAEGERVVSGASFLVDSESRLRAALLQHGSPDRKASEMEPPPEVPPAHVHH
jgi:RND family efflux transporter MFP subunit